jgi:4-hydroxy-2-oxoheptanedioate aldolase
MTMFDQRLAKDLKEQHPLTGVLIGIPSPALVEMAGLANFDFVLIDNEHGPAGVETTEHLIRAARAVGVPPVVRVSGPNQQEILRTLDLGAAGVQVPQVNTAEQAKFVVEAAKYPPMGSRGAAFMTRAAGFGFLGGRAHLEASNQQTVVITHVETVEAVQNLDAMLAVKGIDVIFIGPTDLSVSMGYPGALSHPEVQATIADCIRRIDAAGVTPGVLFTNIGEYHRYAGLGARYIVTTITGILVDGLKSTIAGTKGTLRDGH